MKLSAEELHQKIQQELKENHGSILDFSNEQQQAQELVENLKKEIQHMTQLNQQMKTMNEAHEAMTMTQIKDLREMFNQGYEAYQRDYDALAKINEKLVTAFDLEKMLMRDYFMSESNHILAKVTQQITAQDEKVTELGQELVGELERFADENHASFTATTEGVSS